VQVARCDHLDGPPAFRPELAFFDRHDAAREQHEVVIGHYGQHDRATVVWIKDSANIELGQKRSSDRPIVETRRAKGPRVTSGTRTGSALAGTEAVESPSKTEEGRGLRRPHALLGPDKLERVVPASVGTSASNARTRTARRRYVDARCWHTSRHCCWVVAFTSHRALLTRRGLARRRTSWDRNAPGRVALALLSPWLVKGARS
jgi:hypothetical protein